MIDDPVLVEDWHPVAGLEQLAGGGPVPARVLGEDIVVWRSGFRARYPRYASDASVAEEAR